MTPRVTAANPRDAQAVDIAPVSVAENDEKTAKRSGAGGSNPAVRFASFVEEITPSAAAPATLGDAPGDVSSSGADDGQDTINEVMSDQIKELSSSLHAADLQGRRLNGFSFEPYSLPASRVCSILSHCCVVTDHFRPHSSSNETESRDTRAALRWRPQLDMDMPVLSSIRLTCSLPQPPSCRLSFALHRSFGIRAVDDPRRIGVQPVLLSLKKTRAVTYEFLLT